MPEKLVIIGGVAAGMKTAAKAKRVNRKLDITVFQDESEISYASCGLTYYISGVIPQREKLVHRTAEQMKEKSSINVYINHCVTKIDPLTKQIKVLNNENNDEFLVPYDKLVIATGTNSNELKIDGIESKNIFYLNSITDADAIKTAVQKAKKSVILGAGFLGVELAESFRNLNLDTTIVVKSDYILRNFDEEIAGFVAKYVKEKNVKIITSEDVLRFEADETGAVNKVITTNHQIDTDIVVICKGASPNSQLAKDSGLDIGPSGGIIVDKYMQTSAEDVYAGGDCAEVSCLITNKPINYSSGSIANRQGRVIAENVCGTKTVYAGSLRSRILKFFDMTIAKSGLSEKEAIKEGYDYESVVVPGNDRAHYFPGSDKIIIKMIAEKASHRILGVQIIGKGDVSKRIDIAAIAMTMGMTTNQLSQVDLTYAPPYSSAMDVIINVANTLNNKLTGKFHTISVLKLVEKQKMSSGNLTILDVRTPEEYKESHVKGAINMPFSTLDKGMQTLDKNKEIITVCNIGRQGYLAYKKLKNNGFKDVKSLEGGLLTWLGDLE